MIDAYLRSQAELDDRAVHLLFSANRWELACVLLPSLCSPHLYKRTRRPRICAALEAGTTVICDRYAFSGVAFTAAKPAHLPYQWCRAPDVGLPAPDLTLFFDVSPEVTRARGGYGEERYEKDEMQRTVREMFARIGEEMSRAEGKGEGAGRWVVVDAGRGLEEVEEHVRKIVGPFLKGVEVPLGALWKDPMRT